VNNTSSYTPLRQAEGDLSNQLYVQPHLTQLLLQRAIAASGPVLQVVKLNHKHSKVPSEKPLSTLYDLVQRGAEDYHLSWPVWRALLKELREPGALPRPPVLLTADGVDHWMGPTLYRNSEHKIIHAHQFTLIKNFLDFLFSTTAGPDASKEFANGGMVLLSTSGSNSPTNPTFALLLNQLRALQAQNIRPDSPDFPLPKPYSKPDERVLNLLTDAAAAATSGSSDTVRLMDLKGLSKVECRGYLEYFAQSGLLHQRITDGYVGEMRGLSGGGVVGMLAKLGSRVTS
jgi:small subunit ribosomal protein S29